MNATEKAVRELKLPAFHVRIEGHVHKTSDDERGWTMSLMRADIIATRMAQAGVSKHIIHAIPMGSTVPKGDPQANRRVEVYLQTSAQYAEWIKSTEGEEEIKRKRRVSLAAQQYSADSGSRKRRVRRASLSAIDATKKSSKSKVSLLNNGTSSAMLFRK
jgi:outer membrane protein OmpA-like peptidoglycan-associated protein